MAGDQPFQNLIDNMPPDRRARSGQRVEEIRRSHPMWIHLTRADGLVLLYGAASGVVSMHLQSLPFPANIFIGAIVGFFLMLMLVIVTKVFLMWEYMRIPVAVVRAVRILLIGFLAFTLLVAAFTGDWPVAILITWLLIPLLLLFCQPKLI